MSRNNARPKSSPISEGAPIFLPSSYAEVLSGVYLTEGQKARPRAGNSSIDLGDNHYSDDQLLSLDQARCLLGVGRTTLWEMRNAEDESRKLPTVCVGQIKKIRLGDLRAYVSRHTK